MRAAALDAARVSAGPRVPGENKQAELPAVEQSEEIQGEPLGVEEPQAWLLPQERDGPAGCTGGCRPSTPKQWGPRVPPVVPTHLEPGTKGNAGNINLAQLR